MEKDDKNEARLERVLFSIGHDGSGLCYRIDSSLTPEQLMMLESALRS